MLGVIARVEAILISQRRIASRGPCAHAELERIIGETDRLLATNHYGELLRDGSRRSSSPPNAGKSSLLNRLVGHERALVSAEPGTTRDFIEERVLAGPHALRLIDPPD